MTRARSRAHLAQHGASMFQLRDASRDDQVQLAGLLLRVDAAFEFTTPWWLRARFGGLDAALTLVRGPWLRQLVAVRHGRIVGHGALRTVAPSPTVSDLDGAGSTVELCRVMTDPEHQGQGIADAIVAELCRHADGQHATVVLEVRTRDRHVVRLYQRHGFIRTHTEHRALPIGDLACMRRAPRPHLW